MSDFNPDSFVSPASSKKAFLGQYGVNEQGAPDDSDEGILVSFEVYNQYMPFKSQQAGKEIWEDQDFIRKKIKGNDKTEVHRPATAEDQRRYPALWAQFKAGKEQTYAGTLLHVLLGSGNPSIPSYAAKNIHTIEDLAQVSDQNLQNLGPGAREVRHRAREYLKRTATADSPEIVALRDQLAEQKRQIDDLIAQSQKKK